MNNQKLSAKNPRGYTASNMKSMYRNITIGPGKRNSSLENREGCLNYRHSKQKIIFEQTSNIRTNNICEIKRSPISMNNRGHNEINKQNAFKQDEMSRIFQNKNKPKKKQEHFSNKLSKNVPQFELNQYFSINNTNINYKNKYNALKTQFDEQTMSKYYSSVLPLNKLNCQTFNCNNQIAFYGEYQSDQLACCYECGMKYQNLGWTLKDIREIKNQNSLEVDELIQKLQKASKNFSNYLISLNQHKQSVFSQIEYQLRDHDFYYDSLCSLIIKKKEAGRKIIQQTLNQIDFQFKQIRNKLSNEKSELQHILKEVLKQINQINKMNEVQMKSYIKQQVSKIPSEQKYIRFSIQSLNVNIGDIKQFQKDLSKYSINLIQNQQNLQKTQSQTPIKPFIQEDQQLNQLMCDQQLQWGTKPKSKPIQPKVNQMYFSFQKNNSIIQENAEEDVSSPGFKKI